MSDEEREQEIRRLADEIAVAPKGPNRSAAWDRIRELISYRSRKQIRKMEEEKGLV